MNPFRRYTGRRVVLQVAGQSIAGVVAETHRGTVVLADSELVESRTVAVDGHVVVPTNSIDWFQVLG